MASLAPFEPDDLIKRIEVWVETADVWRAGTDDNVHLRLFSPPGVTEAWQVNLDNSAENFERGARDYFDIPHWYFAGRIMADITHIQLYKNADDLDGGWALAQLQININGRNWYTSPRAQPLAWLQDSSASRHWTEPQPPIVPFTAPKLGSQSYTALPASPIDKPVQILGGKAPFTWQLKQKSGSPLMKPFIDPAPNPARDRVITGTSGPDMSQWTGEIIVTDTDGRTGTAELKIASKLILPAPTVTAVSSDFGWCDGFPSATGASVFTVSGTNFDTRTGKTMKATFAGAAGARVAAVIQDLQTGTATIVVPDGAESGPIEIETETGRALTGEVTIHPSPYRFHYGFAFPNFMEDDNSADGFPNTFDWARYEEAYGMDAMWLRSPFGDTVPDPFAGIFYLATKDLIDKGCCHGFSMVSLRIREGIVGHTQFPSENRPYPLMYTLWDKRNETAPAFEISNMIQAGQLAMMSVEAFSFYLDKMITIPRVAGKLKTMDARPMLADITGELKNGWNNPRLIAFAKGWDPTEGHVVVPYTGTSNAVRVYNPNRPARQKGPTSDPGSVFNVDISNGNWSFDMGSADATGNWQPDNWGGLYCFAIPLSAYGRQSHWTIVATLDHLSNIFMGSCIGGPGTTVEPILGLRDMPTIGPRPMRALEGPAKLRVTSKDGPGLVSIMLASGQALSVEEIDGSVVVEVDPKAGTARVVEEKLNGTIRPVLRLVTRNGAKSVSRTFAVRATAGASMGAVGLDWSGDVPEVTADVTAVDLHTRRVDRLAFDDAVELVSLPRTLVSGAAVTLSERGEVTLQRVDGRPVDLAGIRRFESNVPAQVLVGNQPITALLRESGRLAVSAITRRPAGPIGSGGGVRSIIHGVSTGRVPESGRAGPISGGEKGSTLTPSGRRPQFPTPRKPLAVDVYLGSAIGLLTIRDRGPARLNVPAGRLQLTLESGTELVSVVEERDGYRAIPRGMLVSSRAAAAGLRSSLVLLAEKPGNAGASTLGRPVGPVHIPLTLVTRKALCHAVTLDLGLWRKMAGVGSKLPAEPNFVLSPELQAVGANFTRTSNGTRGPTLGIAWPARAALSGRILLGSLVVAAPDQPGSIWVLGGDASASGPEMGDVDVRVVPIELRRPGVDPAGNKGLRHTLTGPRRVGEGETIELAAPGVAAGTTDVGWWVSDASGQARVTPAPGGKAQVRGWMAGAVRVNALVGNTVLTCDLVVEPRPGWAPIAGDKLAETKVPMPGPSRAEIDPLRLSPWEVMRDQVWNPPRDQLRAKVRVDIGYALGKMDVSKIGGTRRPGG